jgi:hypothetical protein
VRVTATTPTLNAIYAAGYEVASARPYHAGVIEDGLRFGFDVLGEIDDVFVNLVPPAVMVVGGLAWDLLDASTADWFYMQRRALAAGGGPDAHRTIEAFQHWWFEEAHAGVLSHHELRYELHQRFEERYFGWVPALYHYLEGEPSLVLERWVIDRGVIKALGFEYVGIRR